MYGKHIFYPKYARVLCSTTKTEPNEKYDVDKDLWVVEEVPAARGGSEVNVNNPLVRPSDD
jgi:hypothetical protein